MKGIKDWPVFFACAVLWILVISYIIVGVSISLNQKYPDDVCKEAGWDYSWTANMEEGYFKCCMKVLVNHEEVESICEVYQE